MDPLGASHPASALQEPAMASAPPRHVCPDCNRSYKAAETLTRHRQNHSEGIQHVCEICEAGFRRKDLLDRHLHIHQQGGSGGSRWRSPRACTRCSRLKIRCDNSITCSRCARGKHACIYKPKARSVGPADVSSTASINSGRTHSSGSAGHIGEDTRDTVMTGLIPGTYLTEEAQQAMDPTEALDVAPLSEDSLWSQATTRPWLHEDLFLQKDPEWIVGSHVWPTCSNNMSQAATLGNFDTVSSPIMAGSWQAGLPNELSSGASPLSVPPQQAADRAGPSGVQATQEQVRSELIEIALNFSNPASDPSDRASLWQRTARKVEDAFELQGVLPAVGSSNHVLGYFVELFFEHFHSLWPLFWKDELVVGTLRPHLYITLSCIGAIYAGDAAANYHFQILEALRMQLLLATIQHQLPEEVHESLCQSLVLIQAAIIYFGHKMAFSSAQQLGSIVVSLARKMNLFVEITASRLGSGEYSKSSKEDWSRNWVQSETRKRLAFGILRADVFVSLLLGTRPLVSFEEVNLHPPSSDALWNGFQGQSGLIQVVSYLASSAQEQQGYLFSDLVRIALERDEQLPNLRIEQLELVLFGLQHYVWRFSHDPGLAFRLSISFDAENFNEKGTDRRDLLDLRREMRDLKNDYDRITSGLEKCKRSLAANATPAQVIHQRNTLLASHLLYDLSIIKLRADLPTIHRLILNNIVKEEPCHDAVLAVHKWSVTAEALVATEQACAAWSLVTTEMKRPANCRAKFNILSHIALLHAAVVVWAYACTRFLA